MTSYCVSMSIMANTFHEGCPFEQEDEEQQPPAPAAVKNLPLEEQLPPDTIRRCHKARTIPCFNVLIQKKDCARATTDLVIESLELPNYFLHYTKPSEVQSKFLISDEWIRFYCFKELLSSTLCS